METRWLGEVHSEHCIRTVHAEANAIAWAARRGIAIEGATAYVSMTPCRDCAKLMITAGIKRVVVKKDYHSSQQSKEMFKLAGVELIIVES
jgi:dCMP deaminase